MSDIFLWYATRGAGAVALILLTTSVVLGVMTSLRFQASGWPRLLTVGLHRNLSLLTVVFLAVHVATAIVDPYVKLGWATAVVPFTSGYQPFWMALGAVAVDLLLALTVTSLLRLRIPYAAWRGVHWLGYACWPAALLHGLGTGTDAASAWMLGLDLACVTAVLGAAVWRLASGSRDPLAGARSEFEVAIRRPPQP